MRVITLKKKNLCWFFASLSIICIVCFLVYAHNAIQSMKCSDRTSQNVIEEMCFEFKAQRLTGNICPAICSEDIYVYKQCLSTKLGKEVYLMEETVNKGEQYILKSKHAYLREYDPISYMDSKSGEMIYPDNENFQNMVKDSVKFNLHINLREQGLDIVKMFSHYGDVSQFRQDSKFRPAFLDSLWSLVQQDEYTTGMYAQAFDNQHIPQLFGSCGHFYMIEYVNPGNLLAPGFAEITQLKNIKWSDQVKIAVGLMDLVKSFSSDLHETLHMCDLKGENFGISKEGNIVKAIDTDMAFFEKRLQMHYASSNCTKHSDCDFFDCKGWCDIPKGACTKVRTNNNLQALCEKIFVSGVHNAFHGLLQQPPSHIRDKLDSLLEMCTNPPRDPTMDDLPGCNKELCPVESTTRWRARKEVHKRLYSLLKQELKMT